MPFENDEIRRAYYREYNRRWYQLHREHLLDKRRQHLKNLQVWLQQFKSKLSCAKCGEDHPACLQFHHRDRDEKSFTISHFLGKTHVSLERLEKEISKCDILCGNCHALYHWNETHDFDNWLDAPSRPE